VPTAPGNAVPKTSVTSFEFLDSTGLDLRGKTVEVALTRDHTIPADAVEKLKAKVKTEQVLSANVESQVLSIAIPSEPSTRDCRAIPLSMK